MIDRLRRLLTGERQPETPDRRVPLALAVLLLEVAHADGDLGEDEWQQVLDILQRHCNLTDDELADLLELAEAERRHSVDFYSFTRDINWAFAPEEKLEIAEAFWQVALADGTIDKFEEAVMRQVCPLIGLSHAQMIDAKLRVKAEGGGE